MICIEKDHTPKGLQISTKYDALLSDLTTVKTRYKHTRQKRTFPTPSSTTTKKYLPNCMLKSKLSRRPRLDAIPEEAPKTPPPPDDGENHQKHQEGGREIGGEEEEEVILPRVSPTDHQLTKERR